MDEQKKFVFSREFEEKLVQAILVDDKFAEQIFEVIDPDLLDLEHTKQICQFIKDYYLKYTTFPSVPILQDMINDKVSSAILKKQCSTYFAKVMEHPLNGDTEYIKDKSLSFFRTQSVKNALVKEVIPLLGDGNIDDIVPIIQKALNRGTDRAIGFDYLQDQEKRFAAETEERVPTGHVLLDKLFKGGWGKKRLFTWLAPAGVGKSHFLVDAGAAALRAGKVVVDYRLELDEIETSKRYDANLTGIEIDHILLNKEKILEVLGEIVPDTAKLIIKEYPMKCASVQTIKAHLARLKLQGIIPDLVIIDYGDLLNPIEKQDSRDSGQIWIDMKSLAQQLNIPVLTATQTNRSGAEADLITPDMIGEDWRKVQHSDVVITAASNMEQKAIGIGKMYVGKNRIGKGGQIFSFTLDGARAKFELYEITEEIEDEIEKKIQEVTVKKAQDELADMKEFLAKQLKKKDESKN